VDEPVNEPVNEDAHEDVNDEYRARAAQFDASPLAQLLGMRVVELSDGFAVVEMELRSTFLNWGNIIHGGVIMALADHAFGCSLNAGRQAYVAVQFSTNFVAAPAVGERLRAEAKVLHAGRRVGLTEIRVTSSSGRLIATATGTGVAVGPQRA